MPLNLICECMYFDCSYNRSVIRTYVVQQIGGSNDKCSYAFNLIS